MPGTLTEHEVIVKGQPLAVYVRLLFERLVIVWDGAVLWLDNPTPEDMEAVLVLLKQPQSSETALLHAIKDLNASYVSGIAAHFDKAESTRKGGV